MADKNYHIHISSSHNWMNLNLKEVWMYRDLILLFIKRNFVVAYKQTILGPAWIFLNPLISSIMYAIVFGGIAGIGTDGVPELLFYLGKVLTAAAIAMLVVYSMFGVLNYNISGWQRLPVGLLAGAVTALLQFFFKNPLISIIAGTAVYMLIK